MFERHHAGASAGEPASSVLRTQRAHVTLRYEVGVYFPFSPAGGGELTRKSARPLLLLGYSLGHDRCSLCFSSSRAAPALHTSVASRVVVIHTLVSPLGTRYACATRLIPRRSRTHARARGLSGLCSPVEYGSLLASSLLLWCYGGVDRNKTSRDWRIFEERTRVVCYWFDIVLAFFHHRSCIVSPRSHTRTHTCAHMHA